MKRWTFVLPFIYFLFLFALAFMDFPRQINRQWLWIQVGGIVFMAALGSYLDGNASQEKVITLGVFTLLWLGLAFIVNIKKEYFVILGLIIELVAVIIVERFLKGH